LRRPCLSSSSSSPAAPQQLPLQTLQHRQQQLPQQHLQMLGMKCSSSSSSSSRLPKQRQAHQQYLQELNHALPVTVGPREVRLCQRPLLLQQPQLQQPQLHLGRLLTCQHTAAGSWLRWRPCSTAAGS
jgi:hypothetical protein